MVSKTDLKKSLKELSGFRAREVSKHRAEEEMERLEATGQESDLKARTWVRKDLEERERKEKLGWEMDMNMLTNLKRGKLKYYFRYLAGIFLRFSSEETIPKKYVIDVSLTDLGIIIKIRGTNYTGAFKPSGLPSYDYHACKILAIRLGNTVAKLEGYRPTTQGGVVLPDQEDRSLYG